jgi:hypothetical protein
VQTDRIWCLEPADFSRPKWNKKRSNETGEILPKLAFVALPWRSVEGSAFQSRTQRSERFSLVGSERTHVFERLFFRFISFFSAQ